MNTITFQYSQGGFSSKPDATANGLLQKPKFYKKENLTVRQIADLIGEGRSWRAGLLENENAYSFKEANTAGTYIIGLDFDDCKTAPEVICSEAKEAGYEPNFWYYTFSQGKKPHYNFRVVWCLEKFIKAAEARAIIVSLMEIYKTYNIDTACKNISRLWHGTNKEVVVLNEELTNLSTAGWINIVAKASQGKNVKNALGNTNKESDKAYAEKEAPHTVEVDSDWINKLRGRCDLLDKWINGDYLKFQQRFLLFLNLGHLKRKPKGQSTAFYTEIERDVIKYFNTETYATHTCNQKQIEEMMRNRTLPITTPIVNNGVWGYMTVPEYFEWLETFEGEYKTKSAIQKQPVENLDDWMNKNFEEFIKCKGISYLKSQTGSGKTEQVIQWLSKQDLEHTKIIYSAPTYADLVEFYERVKWRFEKDQKFYNENDIVLIKRKFIENKKDRILMKLGLPTHYKDYERYIQVQRLLDPKESGLFLCSHKLLTLLNNINADHIIVDENIEEACFTTNYLYFSQLHATEEVLKGEDCIEMCKEVERIKTHTKGDSVDLTILKKLSKTIEENIDEYIDRVDEKNLCDGLFNIRKGNGNISDDGKQNRLRIFNKSNLFIDVEKTNTPIHLMSATPKTELIDLYYGSQITMFEAPVVENTGKIIQYATLSGAKGLATSHEENTNKLINYVKEKIGVDLREQAYVITFKGFEDYWENAGFRIAKDENGNQIHLQNSAGLDCLKGKKVIIAGKFDYPKYYYEDIYNDIGGVGKLTMSNQRCNINGYNEIKIMTYNDERIRKLHLANINHYIEQATGRARALREKSAEVYIFSNYPIKDADEVITDV